MDLTEFFIHTATVEPYTGATPTGDGYGTAQDVPGFLDDGLVLSRNAGAQQLESKSVFLTSIDYQSVFLPESRVTCNGRVMQVKEAHLRDGGDLLPEVEHLEVDLA